ncbi:MAG TPA: ferritin family protein [Syntrophorhabdales bacterium]|nr:ferritin family protein [Syntrophorhabdales bacterium]
MSILNAHDVVRFAIRIEEDGELFYREAARLTEDREAKALFSRLADEEVGHRKIFQTISENIGEYAPPETYDGEYMAYLRDHIDGKAVFREDLKGSLKAHLGSVLTAIDFAIGRETDSILYYQEARVFVPGRQQGVVDRIIEEERKHFILLSNVRKGYL